MLYVETLIGVTCSETSYRRVALIFRGSYMLGVGGGARGGLGCMCGGWYTLDAAVDAPSYSTAVTKPPPPRGCCEFVSPLICNLHALSYGPSLMSRGVARRVADNLQG